MPIDYRLDPFQDVLNPVTITGETHIIPSVSPFTIRLGEVPLKETPSSISLTIGGVLAEEVSSAPAAGQFWPDYSTGADGDDNWNTGTILFNASDAGKTVVVTYKGTGVLVDSRHQTFVFLQSGSVTAPGWATHAIVSGCGGGGGGGGVNTSNALYLGGPGGAGGHANNYVIAITPGMTYTITIGAGGIGGVNANGSTGGTTSFGTLLSLTGGTYGERGTSTTTAAAAGSNGTGTTPAGFVNATTLINSDTLAKTSNGASGLFGAGSTMTTGTAKAGIIGNGYGSGGTGACGNTGYRGGSGAPGILIVKWVA